MAAEPIVVTVERDLEDLLPVFLEQRRNDLATIARALPARDFEVIRKAGHGMAGAGTSYGFEILSELGQRIVEAARAGDMPQLQRLHQAFADVMSRLVVKIL